MLTDKSLVGLDYFISLGWWPFNRPYVLPSFDINILMMICRTFDESDIWETEWALAVEL